MSIFRSSKSASFDYPMSVGILVLVFIILALAQLIYHLALSFEAIKYAPPEEHHGFEPLMGLPIESPPMPGENEAEK